MERILASPEFQALAPFAVALVVTLALRATRPGWTALAVACGFLTIVLLVNGVTVTPLTGTRKIMLIALGAAPAGLALATAIRGRALAATFAAGAGLATLWVFWTVLSRKSGLDLVFGVATIAYVVWLVSGLHGLAGQPLRAAAGGTALALGTGISVLLGASALLGQLGMALGAASGALLLIAALFGNVQPGSAFTLLVALTSGLLGGAGVLLAQLPWFALLPLLLVPAIARVPMPERLPRWLTAGAVFACAAAPAATAVLLTLLTQDTSSGY